MKDLFSDVSQEYSRYRPDYPREVFSYLASLPKKHEMAWDAGTGNGQAARGLIEFFDRVVATDISADQLGHAWQDPKITYRQAPSHESGLPEHSVDLITVAQALHWFDHPKFFDEVARVGREGAFLGILTYDLPSVNDPINLLMGKYYHGIVGNFWEPERKLVEDHYDSIRFPFDELPFRKFVRTLDWSWDQYLGYLRTWSATRNARKKLGYDPTTQIAQQLQSLWGAESRAVQWSLTLRVFSLGPGKSSGS